MEEAEFIPRLRAIFVTELQDHVRDLERNLLDLEKSSVEAQSAEILDSLFRTAHSLKGAARSVDARPIEATCHHLEEIFSAAKQRTLSFSPEIFQVLLATVDVLREAGRQLDKGTDLAGGPVAEIVPRLAALTSGRMTVASAATAATASAVPLPSTRTEADGLVRVPVTKLDSLITRSNELLVSRTRTQTHRECVAKLQEFVKNWRAEHQSARAISRQLHRFRNSPDVALTDTVAHGTAPPALQASTTRDRDVENLQRLERDLQSLAKVLSDDHRSFEQMTSQLDAELRRMRMVPFSSACDRLERTVRDFTTANDKKARLVIRGGDIEIDKAILDGLKDPLLHLLRNALDHGLETPEARRRAGKSETGTISVTAALRGATVSVTVADDGCGIDIVAIREQASKQGLNVPADEQEAAQFVFLAGFSTSPAVTRLSGRGVGLDVVRTSVEAMRGFVELWFKPGEGTRFTLILPLTLTTIRGLLVAAGGSTFVIDSAAVQTLLRIGLDDLETVEGRQVVRFGDRHVPIFSLADILDLGSENVSSSSKLLVASLSFGQRQIALAVDELIAEQEIVVQSLGPRLERIRNFAGATVLPNGRIAPILNTAEILYGALNRQHMRASRLASIRSLAAPKKRLLLADDSVTTRTLEKNILEAAGYEVLAVSDGAEAWRLLQEKGADLVVSDIQMPKMDGFTLTEALRSSKRFRDVPIVLVTALEDDRDRARGIEVGADAYIPKNSFDQRALLDTIAQLL